MSINCIILYGDSARPLSKYAGTFRIATELRNHGYTVQTIDVSAFNNFDDDLEYILDKIISEKTLWIGFSTTFFYNIFGFPYFRTQTTFEKRFQHIENLGKNLKKFINFVKGKNPKIKLIAGGSRKFMLEQFDFKIFKFYSDKEIIEFTDYCAGKAKQINLKYFSNLIEGSEYENFTTSTIEFTKSDIINSSDFLPIEISRGCIFRCKFCAYPLNGKTKGEWIKHTDVLRNELINNYEIHRVTNYIFTDDTYNDSSDKVKLLYDEVFSKLPFKINFTCYIRLDLMMRYPETVDYLAESGLTSALFGIETINHESGKAIGKGVDPKLQFEFLREIKNKQFKDVTTQSGFIIGLPKDRPNEMEILEEFLFSDENCLDNVQVEPLYITPKDSSAKMTKNYYSEFDLEYQKYGYECYEEIEDSAFTDIRWKNKNLNFDFYEAFTFSRKINYKIANLSDKFKNAGWEYPYFLALGVTKDDLKNLSKRQISEKYDIKSITEEAKIRYKNSLKEIINQL